MSTKPKVIINTQTQTLFLDTLPPREYPVSTALNGVGEKQGSGCTPRGLHTVRALIGKSCPLNCVFVARRPSGEIYSSQLAKEFPERDWILTRIIWLSGMERGLNRMGEVDSFRRFIYIHGTPETEPMGIPESHGCIRMRNHDVVQLFDQLDAGDKVLIK